MTKRYLNAPTTVPHVITRLPGQDFSAGGGYFQKHLARTSARYFARAHPYVIKAASCALWRILVPCSVPRHNTHSATTVLFMDSVNSFALLRQRYNTPRRGTNWKKVSHEGQGQACIIRWSGGRFVPQIQNLTMANFWIVLENGEFHLYLHIFNRNFNAIQDVSMFLNDLMANYFLTCPQIFLWDNPGQGGVPRRISYSESLVKRQWLGTQSAKNSPLNFLHAWTHLRMLCWIILSVTSIQTYVVQVRCLHLGIVIQASISRIFGRKKTCNVTRNIHQHNSSKPQVCIIHV